MTSRLFSFPTALSLGLLLSCVTDAGEGSASDADISRCQGACDQLKLFDCADSGQHAACFAKCETASEEEIERFDACVRTDICDPTCPGALPDVGDDAGGDGDGVADDGVADDEGAVAEPGGCVAACEAIIADGCFPAVSCEGFCGELTSEQRAFVVACESLRDGCSFPEECGALLDDVDVDVDGGDAGETGSAGGGG